LRTDPKSGKEYLVADGTTWVVDGKVFECCRGDIVMKTETTTHKPTTAGKKVVLITGGYAGGQENNATQHSAEIFSPNSPPCILPDLPERYYGHTQDSGMICGGRYTQYTCRKWSPKEGDFPEKPVHYFKPGRYFHVSWTPVSENETFLIGGGSPKTGAQTSTTIVKPGILNGTTGFKLVYPLNGACSIPDPETDTVVITGGYYYSSSQKNTSVYNENGFVEDLGDLNNQRSYHGCTSYIADKKRIFLVTGGYYAKDTTEILEGKKWIVLKSGNLPVAGELYGLSLATINNEVFAFGGLRGSETATALSSILKFNIDEGKWYKEKYQMSRPRGLFGISVVDFKYYSKACLK